MQTIKQLSQIQHVLKRPSMYIGSITKETHQEFSLEDDYFKIKERDYIQGLIKIFNELIDNSIDEYVRTKGEYSNKIQVKITNKTFEIQDNGRGIPNTKMTTLDGNLKYQAEVAFTTMLSGANYDNEDEATIGANGLGSKASSIFSKKSIIKNDDGKIQLDITTKNHLEEINISETSSKQQGVYFKIYPDLEYFNLDEIDEIHQTVIKERLLHLSMAYPGITFKFNNRVLRLNQKKYFGMFNIKEIFQTANYTIGVSHADSEQFEQFSLVNGLLVKTGTHFKVISDAIVNPMREKLVKKFKTIKPADIRNKLRLVVVMNNFLNARGKSQTKEDITNSDAEIKSYLGEDFKNINKLIQKIQKNQDIMLPITELFLLKEQAKQNAELKKLNKTKKKIKLEKYLPATRLKKVLLICEGASAVGGLMPALGREDFGYFELKGVPLNAYDAPQSKFTNNKELSELYQVVTNEDYKYIITATDSDADGSHIKGLLLGFFQKYLPDILNQNKFGELKTPIKAVIKNKKLQRWVYELQDELNLKSGEIGKYYKGLGSFKSEDLKHIVKQDGIKNMIRIFEVDNKDILDNWLLTNLSDKRKEYIQNNFFDITGV